MGRVLARGGRSVRIAIPIAAVLVAGCGSVVVDRVRSGFAAHGDLERCADLTHALVA